ncbi:MAG: hypothetical protein ACKOUM_07925 [Sphingopyxis sp.]
MADPANTPNNKGALIIAIGLIPGLLVAIIGPFSSVGDGIKPGLGDLLNGTVAMALMLCAVIIGLFIHKKSKR